MSLSIKLGNLLYKNAFVLYKPMYALFKNKQDAFEIALLKKHIRKNDIVLDIGANIGFYATILSKLVGESGRVHCFEPDQQNFKHLKKTTGLIGNITLNNKAVGPNTEQLKIYTSKDLNVDHRTYKPEEYDQEMEVSAVSIDDYLLPDLKADFIKIDIQGFEMQAIQGMKKTLEKNKHIKIISEFWPYGLHKAGSSLMEYYTFLTDLGFVCLLMENNDLVPLNSEKIKSLEPLDHTHYFNIFASRQHV